jgi:hypothetical protein
MTTEDAVSHELFAEGSGVNCYRRAPPRPYADAGSSASARRMYAVAPTER